MKHTARISRLLPGLALCLAAWTVAPADDERHLARPLGTDPASVTQSDGIAAGDWIDYYSFTLTEKRAVNAMLSNLTVDANLYLMSSSGHVIKLGSARGISATSVRYDLAAGTYFVAIYAWDRTRSSNYTLQLRTWIPVTGGIAKNIGTLDGMGGLNATRSDAGRISLRTGWVDYWFTLPDTRTVTMSVSSPAGSALFNDKQQFQALLKNGRLVRTLDAGRHFVRLFRDPARDINYSISITAATPSTNDTAGNLTQRGENANIWPLNAAGAELAVR